VAHVHGDRGDADASGRMLDRQTRECLSCHDGASASESNNPTPRARWRGYADETGRQHPVGVQYRSLSRPTDSSPLRPAALLPREVALPDGKVACVSCHNLRAPSCA
jgi:hypothetical protein